MSLVKKSLKIVLYYKYPLCVANETPAGLHSICGGWDAGTPRSINLQLLITSVMLQQINDLILRSASKTLLALLKIVL